MKTDKFAKTFGNFLELAGKLAQAEDADALVVMISAPTDWEKLKTATEGFLLIVLAASLLLGRYTGYRLNELYRFRRLREGGD